MASPKLRFKAFDGDWSLTSFQDLFTFKNGVNATKEQYGSGIKFINVLDIINNSNGITYDSIIGSVNITSEEIDKNLVQYGDVLFQRSSETREEVGQSNVYLSDEPVVFGGFVIRGSAQKEYDPVFMNGLLKTDSLRDQLTQLSGGSTRFNIGQDSLNKVSAYLPSKEEQTKIASFLSAVDEKIAQLTQKHELLSQYKQGMMQKLFSQQIRFKADDGSEFREWETKTIKELNLYISDGNYGELYPTSAQFVDHGVPFIRANNIKNLKVTNNDMRFIEEDLHQILNSGHLKTNDIIVTTRGDIGMLALVDSSHEGSNINAQICLLRVIDQFKLSPQFLLYFLHSNFGQKQFKELQTGSALKQLPKKSLDQVITLIPSINEQTKIANFLSSIDQKIDVVSEQLEQAKLWKKGLLQQMFV